MSTRSESGRYAWWMIVTMVTSLQVGHGQIAFPDGQDKLVVDPDGGPNGQGRIYIGDDSGNSVCHYRVDLNIPSGAVGRAILVDGGVWISFGIQKIRFIKSKKFDYVDTNGNPCPIGTSEPVDPQPTGEDPDEIDVSVSNDADDFAITCNARYAVVVGANSATPATLVDLTTNQEVDTFPFTGFARSVAACDDGQSVLVVFDGNFGTNSTIKRLIVDDPGTLTDSGATLAYGGTTQSVAKVYAVPGSQVGIAIGTQFGAPDAGKLISFSLLDMQLIDSVSLVRALPTAAAVSCNGNRVYVRSGNRGVDDFIEGFDFDPVTGAISNTPSLVISNVSFVNLTVYENPLAVTPDGTRLIASEPAFFPTPDVPGPQVTSFDAVTGARLGIFEGPEFAEPSTVATASCCITNTTPPPAEVDLAASVSNVVTSCTNTSKGVICTSTGTLSLLNNDVEFGAGDFALSSTCKVKEGKPPKCKLSGTFTLTSFNHGNTPSVLVGLYLSDDATFDGSDAQLMKKELELDALAAAFAKGKAVKLKAKLPAGTDVSGRFVLVVIDTLDEINETDELDNVAAIGPFP